MQVRNSCSGTTLIRDRWNSAQIFRSFESSTYPSLTKDVQGNWSQLQNLHGHSDQSCGIITLVVAKSEMLKPTQMVLLESGHSLRYIE